MLNSLAICILVLPGLSHASELNLDITFSEEGKISARQGKKLCEKIAKRLRIEEGVYGFGIFNKTNCISSNNKSEFTAGLYQLKLEIKSESLTVTVHRNSTTAEGSTTQLYYNKLAKTLNTKKLLNNNQFVDLQSLDILVNLPFLALDPDRITASDIANVNTKLGLRPPQKLSSFYARWDNITNSFYVRPKGIYRRKYQKKKAWYYTCEKSCMTKPADKALLKLGLNPDQTSYINIVRQKVQSYVKRWNSKQSELLVKKANISKYDHLIYLSLIPNRSQTPTTEKIVFNTELVYTLLKRSSYHGFYILLKKAPEFSSLASNNRQLKFRSTELISGYEFSSKYINFSLGLGFLTYQSSSQTYNSLEVERTLIGGSDVPIHNLGLDFHYPLGDFLFLISAQTFQSNDVATSKYRFRNHRISAGTSYLLYKNGQFKLSARIVLRIEDLSINEKSQTGSNPSYKQAVNLFSYGIALNF